MNEIEKMNSGQLYNCADPEILAAQNEAILLQEVYNNTSRKDQKQRQELLKQMFASVGQGCTIEPPLHANWGGHFVFLGDNVYANFNLTLVDDAQISIGSDVLIGPNVTLTTAGHPLDPKLRKAGLQFSLPITIEDGVWLGAGVIVMPGITIGKNAVVGAGSVVTHDIPADTLAYGVPARIIRKIGEQDRKVYFRDFPVLDEDWAFANQQSGHDEQE